METVFLSYSRADGELAERVERALRGGGFEVWRDIKEMKAGAQIAGAVAEAIDKARFFVPLMTPQALRSNWFVNEVEMAIFRRNSGGDLVIAPLLGATCDAPPLLKHLQHFDLTLDLDDGLAKVAQWLRAAARTTAPLRFELCVLAPDDLEALASIFPNLVVLEMLAHQLDLETSADSITATGTLQGYERLFATAAKEGKAGHLLRMLQQFDKSSPKHTAKIRRHRTLALGRPKVALADFGELWRDVRELRAQLHDTLELPRPEPKVDAEPYRVAVVGAFSAGKSTLINAMLGRAVLPETNRACTPCPTFVYKIARGARERAVVTNMSVADMSSLMISMLARAGIDDTELERLLGEGDWSGFLLVLSTKQEADAERRRRRRATLEEFLIPTAQALTRHASLLGQTLELPLEELCRIRAPGPAEATEHLLLKRIDVYVEAEFLTDGVCLIDTPGVTSQNPVHKEFAFNVVQNCHALVVVEPFNAPLGEGPDGLMDAFYSRVLNAGSGINGSTAKIFVVLNKCDLGKYDRTGTSVDVHSTIEDVRNKYSSSWGVPRDRYFGVSGLVFLEELEASSDGPSTAAIDPLLLEFRRFMGRLNRYLVDAIEKTSALAELSEQEGLLQSNSIELQARMESLQLHAASRAGLIQRLSGQRDSYAAGLDWTRQQLALLKDSSPAVSTSALADALRDAKNHAVEDMSSHWAVSRGLGDRIFERWFSAVFRDELPLRAGAILHTWATNHFPSWVRSQIHNIVSHVILQIEGEEASTGRSSLLPPLPLRPTQTKEFASGLPSHDALRTTWELVCIQKAFRGNSKLTLEERVDAFFEQVLVDVRESVPSVVARIGESLSSQGLIELSGRVAAMDSAIAGAQRDAERSTLELQTALSDTERAIQKAQALKLKLEEVRLRVERF